MRTVLTLLLVAAMGLGGLATAATGGPLRQLAAGGGFVGVAVAPSGSIFVVDSVTGSVQHVTAARVRTVASGFSQPNAIAVDRFGDVFVSDAGNDAIKEMIAVAGSIPASATTRTIASDLHSPTAVAFDAAGNLFAATSDGIVMLVATGGRIAPSPVKHTYAVAKGANGIAIDARGDVIVTDPLDSVPVGIVAAVNGHLPREPTLKALAPPALFAFPWGVAVDAGGNAYVADNDTAIKQIAAVGGRIPPTPGVRKIADVETRAVAIDRSGNVISAGPSGVKEVVRAGGGFPAADVLEKTTSATLRGARATVVTYLGDSLRGSDDKVTYAAGGVTARATVSKALIDQDLQSIRLVDVTGLEYPLLVLRSAACARDCTYGLAAYRFKASPPSLTELSAYDISDEPSHAAGSCVEIADAHLLAAWDQTSAISIRPAFHVRTYAIRLPDGTMALAQQSIPFDPSAKATAAPSPPGLAGRKVRLAGSTLSSC